MKKTTLLTVSIFCSTLSAQSFVSSPPGYLSVEGPMHSFDFGAYANGRLMYLDGEMRGSNKSLKDLALRHDYWDFTTGASGRYWRNVTLDLSHCDLATPSSTFSKNPTTTPSRVFQGAVMWPTVLGLPSRLPAEWGGPNGRLRFPFRSAFAYNGSKDLCIDADFSGGALLNGHGWGATHAIGYDLDGHWVQPDAGLARTVGHGWQGLAGCRDWNSPIGTGSYARLSWTAYGSHTQDPKTRGTHFVSTTSYFTAPNAVAVHVIGLRGSRPGQVIPGTRCNKLFLDLSTPTLLQFVRASRLGTAAWQSGYIPHRQVVAGTEVWFQAAWSDSRLAELKLTNALSTVVPPLPRPLRRALVLQADASKKGQQGALLPNYRTGLIMRFAY